MHGPLIVFFMLTLTLIISAAFYFSRVHALKFAVVALAVFLSSSVYFGFENYKGWASHGKYPTGWIVAIEIRNPDKEHGDPGDIMIWMYPKEVQHSWIWFSPALPEPRAFHIEMNESNSRKMNNAKQKLKQGYQILIEGEDEGGQDGKSGTKQPKGKKEGLGDSIDYDAPGLHIIPPEEFLKKDEDK
jgi:hypothetical protein